MHLGKWMRSARNMQPNRHERSPVSLSSFRMGLLACLCAIVGCKQAGTGGEEPGNAEGGTTLTVWSHHGKPAEWEVIQQLVHTFNARQAETRVNLVEIPEADYDTQVQSAAASRDLPDVLEFDGPLLANYAWKGYLKPLDDILSPSLEADLLPSILKQGRYAGHLYAVAQFDSGLGLFANAEQLSDARVRVPKGIEDAWTVDEFDRALAALAGVEAARGGDGQVLDLKRDYRGEWWTFGFYPILLSAGADLINRDGYETAEGVLNSPQSVAALNQLQQWFIAGRVDPNTDGRAFVDERVAVSWVGHWEYPRYRKALGERLLLLPLPDFGHGPRTGMGSWAWGITRRCQNPDAAMQFLEFLLEPEQIAAITRANGAVPARRSVVESSELYNMGGPLHLYVEQLERIATPRPVTPAYPVITSAFQAALQSIMQGGDVTEALNRAVKIIDADIRQNEGYPTQNP